MISSTALDLPEHRKAVREACIRAGASVGNRDEKGRLRSARGVTGSAEEPLGRIGAGGSPENSRWWSEALRAGTTGSGRGSVPKQRARVVSCVPPGRAFRLDVRLAVSSGGFSSQARFTTGHHLPCLWHEEGHDGASGEDVGRAGKAGGEAEGGTDFAGESADGSVRWPSASFVAPRASSAGAGGRLRGKSRPCGFQRAVFHTQSASFCTGSASFGVPGRYVSITGAPFPNACKYCRTAGGDFGKKIESDDMWERPTFRPIARKTPPFPWLRQTVGC